MADAEASQPLLALPKPPGCREPKYRRLCRKIFSWHVFKIALLGQLLSIFICGTSVTSELLVENYMVNTPVLQNFITYFLLSLVYTSWLACRSGEEGLLYLLRHKWWKYLLLAIVDVEGNYCLVKAFQFTTLTSVQLLDCMGIPLMMVLSWFLFRTRFRWIHYVAVVMCLLGVVTMVSADVLSGREDGKAANKLIGDILVIVGASLYAVSNICQEYVVKNLTCVEFLGMLGFFGTVVSGTQLVALESVTVGRIAWNWCVGLLYAGYTSCLFGLYSMMTFVVKHSSATSVNLGILTADFYSLFFGLFLFGYKFSGLYILSFVIIMMGFVIYCSVTTYTSEVPAESTNGDTDGNAMLDVEAALESDTSKKQEHKELHHISVK
ncbi:solute carrier family 35 member F2-like [Hyperolius riggenbachi]|uniref:solute carrier family 35 member F2-like n=1 Tax=Hyperolius riggenbachi TaxID=752182 RepID=UPI0035A2C5C2